MEQSIIREDYERVRTSKGFVFIGFDSFEEAQEYARVNGGDIVELHKRDGEHIWRNDGRTNKPYKLDGDTYGDDYMTYTDADEWWEEEFQSFNIREYRCPAQAIERLQKMEEIYDAIWALEENQQLLIHKPSLRYEIIAIETMSYREDVYTYKIGVSVVEE